MDLGATRVRCYQILEGYRLGPGYAEETFEAFQPPPLEEQLREAVRDESEREAAHGRLHQVAKVIGQVGWDPRLAIAAPGLKTADGNGIRVSLNGPRIPDFRAYLKERFQWDCGPLQDDSLMAAVAEQVAPEGLLHEVESAYVVGPGTGLAEAVLKAGYWLDKSQYEPAWKQDLERLTRARHWDENPQEALEALTTLVLQKDVVMVVLSQRLADRPDVAQALCERVRRPVLCSRLRGAAAIGALFTRLKED